MPYPVKASSGNPIPMVIPWQLDQLHYSTKSQCALYACLLNLHWSSLLHSFAQPSLVKSPSLICSTFTDQVSFTCLLDLHWSSLLHLFAWPSLVKSPSLVCSTFTGQVSFTCLLDLHWSSQFRQDLFGTAFIGWSEVEIHIYVLLLHHIHSWDLIICFSSIHSCDFGRHKWLR